MRQLILKYGGECRACGAELVSGHLAGYEKRVGIFCPGCTPTDPEVIRQYRQEGADRRADKLDSWAESRERESERRFGAADEAVAGIPFGQPILVGHHSERRHRSALARCDANMRKGWESSNVAREHREKADSLRAGVRVKGDAERAREAEREEVRAWLVKGLRVTSPLWGPSTVVKVNKKTAKLAVDRLQGSTFSNGFVNEAIEWLTRIEGAAQ